MRILAYAPCRVSLFGGGSDLPSYKNGFVINMAINLRNKVTLSTGEDIWSVTNVFPFGADSKLFYNVLDAFGYGSMHHSRVESTTEAFIKSGLGTSGSSVVALIKACLIAKEREMTREEIAEKAFKIESTFHNTGRQDMYSASFGGMNAFSFGDEVNVNPIGRSTVENIKKYLFLYYIGGQRQPQVKSFTNLDKVKEIALEAYANLDSPRTLGSLLNKAWEEKKKSNPQVSNPKIDEIYELALRYGAWGGKVCGSGGAGYIIFMTDNRERLSKVLKNKGIEEVDFSPDFQGVEGRIL